MAYGWRHYARLALARHIVRRLNALMSAHPDVAKDILALTNARIPCSDSTIEHPTIQVEAADGVPALGFIGLLNGIVGTQADGKGYIALGTAEDSTRYFWIVIPAGKGRE